MGVFKEIFAWWTGNTIGTRVFTWRQGVRVGSDSSGNIYYQQRRGNGPLGCPRRWVTYGGESDPTTIPPEWHGWMHYTTDIAPPDQHYHKRAWQQPHRPNMTGTTQAYRPKGSVFNAADTAPESSDYSPWSPGD